MPGSSRKRRGPRPRPARAPVPSLALSAQVAVSYNQRATPLREWDRATQFLSAFAISGFVAERTAQGEVIPLRPASVVLVGGPGSGKTELVERFKRSEWLTYHNDLTVRSLLPLLRKADQGILTHVAAPEFNKWFQRKAFVAENCIGVLCQAMEEGVYDYSVGGTTIHFNGARLGLFAGMTPRTMTRRREMLADMGFLSRICALEWQLPREEREEIVRRMNLGIVDDLDAIGLPRPQEKQQTNGRAVVAWDSKLGEEVAKFVKLHWPDNDLRTFKRFKTLMLTRAYLIGKAKVTADEWSWLRSYDDYWQRMIVGED